MKKITKWLLFLVLGTGLSIASCSKDGGINGDNGGDDAEDLTGPAGYFSIRLTGGITGRNTPMVEEQGEPKESFILWIRVVLYDKETQRVAYVWDLDADNRDLEHPMELTPFYGTDVAKVSDQDAAPADPTETRFFMVPKKVVKKDYLMVVVANPDGRIEDATRKGSSLVAFEQAATYRDEYELDEIMGATIMMSNARGYVDVVKDDIRNSPGEALQNGVPKEVLLDRVAAKVTIGGWPMFNNGTGDFSTFTWRLDGTNKKTFWMRNQTITAEGAMEIYNDDRGILYARDPNFDGFSNDRLAEMGAGGSFPDLSEEFNRITKDDVTNPVNNDSWEYALENTMDADEQWEDVTTRVVLKGNFVPDGFAPGESYYFFQGRAYKHTQIEEMMYNDLWTGHELLRDAVEADRMSGARVFNFVASNSGVIAGSEPAESVVSEEGLRFYKGGISYYSVLLRHFNDSQKPGPMSYGRYGIVRNNVYKVTVNNISGPGGTDIPEPEGPDDKGEGYLSADISIQPWYVRDQVVEDL